MIARRAVLLSGSALLGAGLVALLIHFGKVDLRLMLSQLQNADRIALVQLVLLNVVLVWLSAEKWRAVDAAVRTAADTAPSGVTSFATTSAGMALGLVIPVQLGVAAARTLVTRWYGGALRRGATGSLFEQFFDLLVFGSLAMVSSLTRLVHGGAGVWILSAAGMTVLTVLLVAPVLRGIWWLANTWNSSGAATSNRFRRGLVDLAHAGFLDASLGRRLVVLSSLRFVVVVLMAAKTAQATGVAIPLWHLAAAIPFVFLAIVVAITPGGLGVNELTYAGALQLFGTPLAVGAQWAVANRILITASCFVVAACGAAARGLERTARWPVADTSGKTEAERETPS